MSPNKMKQLSVVPTAWIADQMEETGHHGNKKWMRLPLTTNALMPRWFQANQLDPSQAMAKQSTLTH